MPKLVIIYDTGTHNTERMAKALEEGGISGGVEVLLKNAKEADISDVENADAIAVGSPNYRDVMMPSVKKLLESLKNIDISGKVGLSFGSYGWGLEAIEDINEILTSYGVEMVQKLGIKGMPDGEELENCKQIGLLLASRVRDLA